jgi:bifunctional UDP-N-acetylglucosamine pyrophosphorylase / glucosamine-1-phosphate N-acetyltransferase
VTESEAAQSAPASAPPVHPAPTVAAVVVLAAGEGTRMKSATPKPLHALCGRTMLGHIVAAGQAVSPAALAVVTGHGRDAVEAQLLAIAPHAVPVHQPIQDGTGHAVRLALAALDAQRAAGGEPPVAGTVVVMPGDTPLLSAASVASLAVHREATGAAAVVLTATVPDPTGYGRVVRDRFDRVKAIVEHADADDAQRRITEVNSGVYAFDAGKLRAALAKVRANNSQGEEYLPDVVTSTTGTRSPGSTTVRSWPALEPCCATGWSTGSCATASRSSIPRRPGSTSRWRSRPTRRSGRTRS